MAETLDYSSAQAKIRTILDAAYVADVGFRESAKTWVMPMACWRMDENLYIHGANQKWVMLALGDGQEVCINITLLDGLVLAKSAFKHSMNYRSVLVRGPLEAVEGHPEKMAAFEAFMAKVKKGRWDEARKPDRNELNSTTLYKISINVAILRFREGGPRDKPRDLDLDIWAGEIPMTLKKGKPVRFKD